MASGSKVCGELHVAMGWLSMVNIYSGSILASGFCSC